jgi:MoxR-like ATPase
MKITIDFPDQDSEILLTRQVCTQTTDDVLHKREMTALLDTEQLRQIQALLPHVVVDEQILQYAVRLVRATRENPTIVQGAGPRASIALIRCARAYALLRRRNYVLPDDIKAMALPVMRHRIMLSADVEIDGLKPDDVLRKLLETVEAPRL